MNIGSIVYATNQGLGILAKAFYDHGVFNRALVMRHPHYENHCGWYPPEAGFCPCDADAFLDGLDVLLLFETGIWEIVRKARKRGVRVVMMPMYEWTPNPLPVSADFYLCPSLLDLQYYSDKPSVFVPVPVEVPWRLRETVRHFVHNAGHGGSNFRNGTPELFDAMQYVQSPIRLTVRGQPGIRRGGKAAHDENRVTKLLSRFAGDPRVDIVLDDVPYDSLWNEGDAFIFPEKFNGLSLPLQEARAAGMLVMATRRFPMTTWLPTEPLIPGCRTTRQKIAVEFDSTETEPRTIARWIDDWYDRDIADYSLNGKKWAEDHSWEVLGPRYKEILEHVA